MTIKLDLAPRQVVERSSSPPGAETPRVRGEGADRIEEGGLGYLARVTEGFLPPAVGEPDRIKMVEACPNREAAHRSIQRALDNWVAGVLA